ncbi:uncharacterized protein RAG0_11058 [Rhynchosporium agropyri]|uniref:GEgh 16 protein n=2 Tax=Rhynchosporium TaxID=38037 RepID=A0A1E1ML76_RHYSE|nr:uncharacterized protein RAG0_11058 [Rhynchosporium agropyri]CZT49844.1 uncharacterized protein RSE6_10738 [Rhynchosporium secalis]
MVGLNTLVKSLLLASTVQAAPAVLDERQSYCVVPGNSNYGGNGGYGNGGNGGTTVVNQVVTTEVVIYQIVINTFIQQNTVLNFGGGFTVVVNNAPTQILTIGEGTKTATNTAVTTVMPAPGGGDINIYQTVNIINYPVVISTLVTQNTIIQGGGGVNIIINNAPTFILTTATGTSTVTATVTSTV